jgi:dTDP-4-amino-4,6-dideoxygalactose transaminase
VSTSVILARVQPASADRLGLIARQLALQLRPRRGLLDKLSLAARARLWRLLGRNTVRAPVPPMYPGALAVDEEECAAARAAVDDVLRRKRLFRHWGVRGDPFETSRVLELERAFARRVGAQEAICVSTGTAALQCALAGLGVGRGHEVILPAYAWYTVSTAVLALGAVPVLAEVDESLTLDPDDVERKLSPLTKVILCVHMRGAPCDMDRLGALAAAHGVRLLEDVAQATGGSHRGRPLGSLGAAAAFSLQLNKIVTTGEGGVVTTSDPQVHRRSLVYHDVTAASRLRLPPQEWRPGLNLRMNEVTAAVGCVQLARLDGLLERMRANARRLREAVVRDLVPRGVVLRRAHDVEGDTGIALVLFLPEVGRVRAVERALVAERVPASRLYLDLERFPDDLVDLHVYTSWFHLHHRLGWQGDGEPWKSHPRAVEYGPDACPRTLALLRRAIHVDVSPGLSGEQVDQIATALRTVVERET